MAIALRREGFHVRVFEAASELTHIGAGIHTYPNATRVLDRWGLLPALSECASPAEHTRFLRYANGEILYEASYNALEQYGFPYVC